MSARARRQRLELLELDAVEADDGLTRGARALAAVVEANGKASWVARELGKSAGYLSMLLAGTRRPGFPLVYVIAARFQIPVEWWLHKCEREWIARSAAAAQTPDER